MEKCSATGAKTSSYRTYVTFREKVVCRKCCGKLIKLINKTVVVQRSLLYLFTLLIQYGYQSVIIDINQFYRLPSLVNFLVILGSQHPFSFNFYFMLIYFSLRIRVIWIMLLSLKINVMLLKKLLFPLWISVFMDICKIGKLHQKWHWSTHKVRENFWAVVLTNFKHPFDITIIKIIIPLYNTNRTIVWKQRNSMDSTLPFLIQRNISHNIACRYCFCFQEYIYCLVAGFYTH